MKRKLFIGSSKEGYKIAEKVKIAIDSKCADWLECIIWDEKNIFTQNASILDSLHKASRQFDYGVFVATADDISIIRKRFKLIARDNVLFELGLFLGSLGMTRAFLIADKKIKLPSDYNGVYVTLIDSKRSSCEKELESLIENILQTKDTYTIKPVPSASLALGYFDSFIYKFAESKNAKGDKLKVIIPSSLDKVSSLIERYKERNPSEELSLYGDNSRPIVYKLKDIESSYWDIPTTVTTLHKLIGILHPQKEIGLNPNEKDYLTYELKNFKGTLEVLISGSDICRDIVDVEWYS